MRKRFFKKTLCGLITAAVVFTNIPQNYVTALAHEIDEIESETKVEKPELPKEVVETPTPEETKPEDSNPEENKSDEVKPEDSNPEENKSDETKTPEVHTPSEEELQPFAFKNKNSSIFWRRSASERHLYDYNEIALNTVGQRYWGETIEEILSMMDDKTSNMASLDVFFKDTIFEGTTRKDLEYYKANGYTLDQVNKAKVAYLKELNEKIKEKSTEEPKSFLDYLADFIFENFTQNADAADYNFNSNVSAGSAYATGNNRNGNSTDLTSATEYFYSHLGSMVGKIYYQRLNDETSFCGTYGAAFSTGLKYTQSSGFVPGYVAQAMNYYNNSDHRTSTYCLAQIYIWCGGDLDLFIENYAMYLVSRGTNAPVLTLNEANRYKEDFPDSYQHAELVAQTVWSAISAQSTSSSAKTWNYGPGYQIIYSEAENRFEPEYARDIYGEGDGNADEDYEFKQYIDIEKRSELNAELLAGAKFSVTTDSSYIDDNTEEITTGLDGKGEAEFIVRRSVTSETFSFPSSKLDTYTYYGTDPGYDEAAYKQSVNDSLRAQIDADLASKKAAQIASTTVNYSVSETKAPEGFTISEGTKTLSITGENSSASAEVVSYSDKPFKSKLIITKADSLLNKLIYKDAEFTLYEWDKATNGYVKSTNYSFIRDTNGKYTVQATYPTAETGYVYYTTSNLGKFKVVETRAPHGFFGDWIGTPGTPGTDSEKLSHEFALNESLNNQEIYLTNSGLSTADNAVFTNVETKGTLHFFKTDADSNTYVEDHGNANLNGAVYDVYVKETILEPDNETVATYDGLVFENGNRGYL